ncbi:MAG: N-formylglutamate amidohydrolase [Rhodobacteraceae bacterium]|nr:N-formylglutamate amidohydrolase [Paracoccaceae bacterium]NKB29791.1 N-formylglutamate amidohydrolase [Paracoccaceae bacterium]
MANAADREQVVEVINPGAAGPVVLVCEHASSHIPAEFADLGLSAADRLSHAVWDPGAEALGRAMAERLDAPFVAGRMSRLLYDCNRPLSSEAAMPKQVELVAVPGNAGLTATDRAERADRFYEPFRATVAATLDGAAAPVLVTIHSFTPTYFGEPRAVEIGILHDSDTRLADAMLGNNGPLSHWRVARNEPYGPADGVTHTLKEHALARGIANVMIEVRNDLLTSEGEVARIADAMVASLTTALATLDGAKSVAAHHA